MVAQHLHIQCLGALPAQTGPSQAWGRIEATSEQDDPMLAHAFPSCLSPIKKSFHLEQVCTLQELLCILVAQRGGVRREGCVGRGKERPNLLRV